MSWRREPFREHYRLNVGTDNSSNSYVSYLNLVDELLGGLDERLTSNCGNACLDSLQNQSPRQFTVARSRANCTSALRAYIAFLPEHTNLSKSIISKVSTVSLPASQIAKQDEIVEMLRQIKPLAVKYYRLTGKPLGVTGEIAELEAAEKLGLKLMDARSPGFDAMREGGGRAQIKGRAVSRHDRYRGRCPSIKGDDFDSVILVLIDRESYELLEIWEAPRERVLARVEAPGSVARNERRSLAISQFKSIADRVWPVQRLSDLAVGN